MLTVAEAAKRAGRDPETIRRWIRAGRLAASKVGGQHMIDEGALAEALRPGAPVARGGGDGVGEAAVAYGSTHDASSSAPAIPRERRTPQVPMSAAVSSPPYEPGWVDRFWGFVDRLPIPAWLFYVGMYLVGASLMHVGRWIDGEVAPGALDVETASQALWFALALAWMHYLKRLAARALPQFDPVVPEARREEYELVRYRMLAMPVGTTRVVVTLPMLLVAVGVAVSPLLSDETAGWAASVILAVVTAVAFGTLPLLIYFNVRMLRLVNAAYGLVDDVPLIDQRPLFSLSNLTMQIGLSWVLVTNVNLALSLLLEGALGSAFDIALVGGFSAVGMVLAFALFLLPLRGIHKKLSDAKNGLVTENAVALDRTRVKLYEALDSSSHDEVDRFDRAITSLLRIRDELRTIPTWPWRQGTLRGFSGAVIAPMVLWGAQQVLARWF